MSVKAARRFYRVDSAHDLQFIDQGESATAENRWTFEIAWEVANKGKITNTAEHVSKFNYILDTHLTPFHNTGKNHIYRPHFIYVFYNHQQQNS